MASLSRRLYIGVTSDLRGRVWKHRTGAYAGFTKRYRITRLVYFETFGDVWAAIAREKELKAWPRRRKIRLIESVNPAWRDLSADWFDD